MRTFLNKDMGCAAMCGKSKAVSPVSKDLNKAFHIPRPELEAVLQSSSKAEHKGSPKTGLSPGLQGMVEVRQEGGAVTDGNRL